jgi:arginyl-tRNA synthetase
MPNVVGSTIARILASNGAEIKEACYQGDVGMHVAKAVWGITQGFDIKEAYAKGSKEFEESEEAKKEIQGINKKIYDNSDTKINDIYDAGRKESLLYFDSIYKKLGTKFDYFFFESEVAPFGKKIVEENTGKIFEKGEGGAIIFKAENFDKSLHTRVFINSEGLPTYEAKELGLAKVKYEKYQYDKSVIITGNEINEYFNVLLCAMKQIFPELTEKTLHLSHGMLRLPSGKMSSRTGDVITAESLIDMVKEKVKDDERVAIGAIKYMILRQSIGGNIIFDIDKSVSTEGDSGVYLQYSYARANSILEKAKENKIAKSNVLPEAWQTTELEKILYRFPEVVLRSGEECAPHYIVNYLTELARAYNSFYGNTQIIDGQDKASSYKVALSEAFSLVMKNGLNILGIPVLEKM